MRSEGEGSRSARVPTFNSIVVLAVVYVVATGLLIAGSRYTLRQSAWEVMEATARLVGNEIASALGETVRQELVRPGTPDREELLSSVTRLVQESASVEYVTIVGADGRPVASNEPATDGQALPSPELLFGEDSRVRVAAVHGPDLSQGRFLVEIPFMADGEPIAYLRLTLRSTAIARLYRGSYLVLTVLAVVGLLTIGGLGLLLHLRYQERQRLAVHYLTAALEERSTEELGSDRSLRPLLAAADRVREKLTGARERTREVREQLLRLGRSMDIGVVILGPDGELEGIGARARELLELDDVAEEGPDLEGAVAEVLAPVRERLRRQPGSVQPFEIDLHPGQAGGRVVQTTVTPFQSGAGGAAVRLRDRAELEAVQRDLLEAAKLRSLRGLYLGTAHELKAPVNAVILNLENLKATLDQTTMEATTAVSLERTLTVLSEEMQRLRRSVELLLSYAAPSTGVGVEPFDVSLLLRDIAALLRGQARQQKVDVVLEPETPSAWVEEPTTERGYMIRF